MNHATIATVHTHNTGVRSTPSPADIRSELQAFLKSRPRLFVTITGTNHFAEIDIRKVCGWTDGALTLGFFAYHEDFVVYMREGSLRSR
jgi:hypothetical protein